MNKADIPFLSAVELSALIQKREVSPVEATEAYLDRIQLVDGRLNSYITVCAEEAVQQAREAEQAISRGGYLGPMHGIPTGVKDQFLSRGIRTTAGSTILWDHVPDEDATVVANLKKAGAVILGKLNLSEFALGDSFYHPAGTPHNPWDLERNPGMSSSGSGAATAAYLCATSLGEDTGGSTRIPAAWSGLVGLRPTWGRVSRYGVLPACWSMDTVGPISRTVEDCAITFNAIAGYDPKDPYTWQTPVPDYLAALDGDVKGLRIGLITEKVYASDVTPEVRDAVVAATAVIGELVTAVKEVSLPLVEHAGAPSKAIVDFEGSAVHDEWLRTRAADYDHNTRVRLLAAALTPARYYYKAQKLRTLIRRQILEALERVDVLALPTSNIPAPKIPSRSGISSQEEADARISGVRNVVGAFNLAGVPALAVPCGFTSTNLPISLQLVGRPFEEALLLKVAHAYQQATRWHTMRPPI